MGGGDNGVPKVETVAKGVGPLVKGAEWKGLHGFADFLRARQFRGKRAKAQDGGPSSPISGSEITVATREPQKPFHRWPLFGRENRSLLKCSFNWQPAAIQ